MPAILKDIRRLEAAHKRGELTSEQFAASKAQLLDAVEDAHSIAPAAPVSAPSTEPRNAPLNPLHIFLLSLAALVACAGLTTLLIGDLTLAMTLTATLFAAIVVRAFNKLDE